MSAPTCVRCGRPMADTAYVCPAETARAAEQLRQIADMTAAARDVAHGFSRHGGGAASGKPGSRLPLDLTATSKLDAVQNELTTWMRHIAAERGVEIPARTINAPAEIIVEAAEWLQGHLEWLRHRQEVSEALSGIAAAARVVAGIARGPGSQKYLGPCGATLCSLCGLVEHGHVCEGDIPVWDCEGDIYARVYADGTVAKAGACRTCRATVATDERTAWLDAEVRGHAFRAAEIGNAYGIRANTIRVWADRGLLVAHGHDRDGRPLFNVGDVLDLAAGDAARRAEEQAKRARRAAAKAEEASDAA
jgi:hypothetical protein